MAALCLICFRSVSRTARSSSAYTDAVSIAAACRGLPQPSVNLSIDNFKAFNDKAGFTAGDRAIQALGRAIVSVASRKDCPFVGHIGGDDFVAVWLDESDAVTGARAITAEASEAMADAAELPEGVAVSGITVATLLINPGEVQDVSWLANRLAALKGHAKRRGHSVHAVARLANLDHPTWHDLVAAATQSGPSIRGLDLRRHSMLS